MTEPVQRIDAADVEAFVNNAHGDLAEVKQLLEREPALVDAAWDWGGGDWETALGAASHMGRGDIAELLIDRGARVDIFAAAMLDAVDVVRALLDRFPALLHAVGPHGIPLRAHAETGEAERVLALLDERRAQG
ncbi:MAG: ankyrin repeat domain-containing protein [Gaiellaceae bacterium]